MTKKDKLVERFLSLPKDFTFDELVKLMISLGFELSNKGKTSGSRVEFIHKNLNARWFAHKPHPGKIMKKYALKDLKIFLTETGFL